MNTTTLTTSITIPKMDLSLLKDLAKKFGWTINNAPANKPGLEEALDNVKNGNIRAVLTGRIVRKCLILRASPWVNVHNTPTRPVGATVKKNSTSASPTIPHSTLNIPHSNPCHSPAKPERSSVKSSYDQNVILTTL